MTVARRFSALRYTAVTATLLVATAAHGKAAAPPFLETAGVIDAPHGFVEMCKTDSSFCRRTDQRDMDDAVGDVTLPMSAAPLAMMSVSFYLDAALLRPVITPIALSHPPLRSPPRSCPSLFSQFHRSLAPLATCGQDIGIAQLARLDTGAIAPDLASRTVLAAPAPQPRAALANEADEQVLLQRINRLVNGRVRQRTDLEIYGQAEVWRRSGIHKGATGDCEDLAIEKRFELADAGFPQDRLSFAIVYARGIGLHTVLVAHLTSGDYVVDSRTPYIQPWAETPYSWIAIQSTEDPMVWHAVTSSGRKV